MDAGLKPAEGDGVIAQISQGHRQQGAGYQFPGGQQQVQFPGRRFRRDGAGQANQGVGGVAHSRGHGHDVRAAILDRADTPGHIQDFPRVGDRTAAVLMHYQGQFACCLAYPGMLTIMGPVGRNC